MSGSGPAAGGGGAPPGPDAAACGDPGTGRGGPAADQGTVHGGPDIPYSPDFDRGLSQRGTEVGLGATIKSSGIYASASRHATALAGPALELARTPTWQRMLLVKTVGWLGSVSLLGNNMTGPGLVAVPLLFQQAGWVFPVLAIIVYGAVASFASLFIVEAMQSVPGNRRFKGIVEFSTLISFYFGPIASYLSQIILFLSLQSTNIASIIISIQTMDNIIIEIFHKTCGIIVKDGTLMTTCPTAVSSSNSPFGDDFLLLSYGYLVTVVMIVPLGLTKIADNIFVQVIATVLTFVIFITWITFFSSEGLDPARLPAFDVPGLGSVFGTVLFNYAYVTTIPSWVNVRAPAVSIPRSLWSVTIVTQLLYILVGFFGALAFTMPANSNLLTIISSSPDASIWTRVTTYLYPIASLMTSIPIFVIIVYQNLIQNRICGKIIGTFLSAVLPFLIAIPLQSGAGLQSFILWSSLIATSSANFLLPLLVYLKSRRFLADWNERGGVCLDRHQKDLLLAVHPWSKTVVAFVADLDALEESEFEEEEIEDEYEEEKRSRTSERSRTPLVSPATTPETPMSINVVPPEEEVGAMRAAPGSARLEEDGEGAGDYFGRGPWTSGSAPGTPTHGGLTPPLGPGDWHGNGERVSPVPSPMGSASFHTDEGVRMAAVPPELAPAELDALARGHASLPRPHAQARLGTWTLPRTPGNRHVTAVPATTPVRQDAGSPPRTPVEVEMAVPAVYRDDVLTEDDWLMPRVPAGPAVVGRGGSIIAFDEAPARGRSGGLDVSREASSLRATSTQRARSVSVSGESGRASPPPPVPAGRRRSSAAGSAKKGSVSSRSTRSPSPQRPPPPPMVPPSTLARQRKRTARGKSSFLAEELNNALTFTEMKGSLFGITKGPVAPITPATEESPGLPVPANMWDRTQQGSGSWNISRWAASFIGSTPSSGEKQLVSRDTGGTGGTDTTGTESTDAARSDWTDDMVESGPNPRASLEAWERSAAGGVVPRPRQPVGRGGSWKEEQRLERDRSWDAHAPGGATIPRRRTKTSSNLRLAIPPVNVSRASSSSGMLSARTDSGPRRDSNPLPTGPESALPVLETRSRLPELIPRTLPPIMASPAGPSPSVEVSPATPTLPRIREAGTSETVDGMVPVVPVSIPTTPSIVVESVFSLPADGDSFPSGRMPLARPSMDLADAPQEEPEVIPPPAPTVPKLDIESGGSRLSAPKIPQLPETPIHGSFPSLPSLPSIPPPLPMPLSHPPDGEGDGSGPRKRAVHLADEAEQDLVDVRVGTDDSVEVQSDTGGDVFANYRSEAEGEDPFGILSPTTMGSEMALPPTFRSAEFRTLPPWFPVDDVPVAYASFVLLAATIVGVFAYNVVMAVRGF